ncbi:MAG: class I SAM-dependent methyltransferase [Acidobacteria bacterium]|nr:MAG: class I SAM-dependent methyltransferase [Acidobacteriota bacterium]
MGSRAQREAWLHAVLHTGNPGDVAFYRRVCAGARRVLEIGCGGGRVLLALARAGHEVTGVELHRGLLARLRRALRDEEPAVRARVRLVAGDAARIDLDERFERVLAPYNMLYCLLDDDALHAVLRRAERHLAPGGRFVFDVYCPARIDPGEAARLEGLAGEPHHVVSFEADGAFVDVFESDTWDPRRQRIDATYHYAIRRGDRVERAVQTIPQRYLYPEQLERALEAAGLVLVERHGDFDGAPFDPDEGLFVGVAARRDDTR